MNDVGPLTPDNYLITPAIEISATSNLSYWATAQDPDWSGEFYNVKLSTTGTEIGDFTETLWSGTTPIAWEEVMIDLSSYAGSTCYIAFQHTNTTDMFYMKLDNVSVSNTMTRALSTPKIAAITNQGMPFRTSGMTQDKIEATYANYVPTRSKALLGYQLDLDGVVVANTGDLFYQYAGLTAGQSYVAGVSALYDEGQSLIVNYQFTVAGGGGDPVIEVIPEGLVEIHDTPPEITTQTLYISNTGTESLMWDITVATNVIESIPPPFDPVAYARLQERLAADGLNVNAKHSLGMAPAGSSQPSQALVKSISGTRGEMAYGNNVEANDLYYIDTDNPLV
jgi:hypothetical protein